MEAVLLAKSATTLVLPAPTEVNAFLAILPPTIVNSTVATSAVVSIAILMTLSRISFARPAHTRASLAQ